MKFSRHTITLTVLTLLIVAGCPRTGSDPRVPGGTTTTGDGGTTATGGGSSGTSSGDGGITLSDALTTTFPDCEEPDNAAYLRAEVLRLVNLERTRAGLDALSQDDTLERQATVYACEMIQYDFFAHDNPVTGTSLSDRAEQFNYEYWIVGENLAAGQTTPAKVVSDWMNSPGHRENILNPAFTELGVGVRTGGSYGTYWVQEFGRPLDAGPYEGS